MIVRPGRVILLIGRGIALLFLALPQFALILRGIQTRGWEGLPGAEVPNAFPEPGNDADHHTDHACVRHTAGLCAGTLAVSGTAVVHRSGRASGGASADGGRVSAVDHCRAAPPNGSAARRTWHCASLYQYRRDRRPNVCICAVFYSRGAGQNDAVPRQVEDAARADGAAGLALFWYITLPLTRDALAAGLTLSWARALGEFGATILFAGSISGRTQTMPLLVYNILESNIDAAIWASLILLGLAFIALIVSQALSRRAGLLYGEDGI